jgi:hypothetical protein
VGVSDTVDIDYAVHTEARDLAGKDTVTLGGLSTSDVERRLGLTFASGTTMRISIPRKKVTWNDATTEALHVWPEVSLGRSFKKLSIHVAGDVVIGMTWGFELDHFLPRMKRSVPWYRRVFG